METPKEKDIKAVSQEEISSVENNWKTKSYPSVKERPYPVYVKFSILLFINLKLTFEFDVLDCQKKVKETS